MPDKVKCPTCGRTVGVLASGAVRRHNNPETSAVCAGGTPKKRRSRRPSTDDASKAGEVAADRSNVVEMSPRRRGGTRKAATMTDGEKAAENGRRAPSKALDRAGHGACGATLRDKAGEDAKDKCTNAKGQGTDHVGFGRCKHHGGASPNGKKHAALERARHELARAKREGFFGTRVSVDPEQALLEEMQRSVGAVRWLEQAIKGWGELERLAEQMRDVDPAGEAAEQAVDRFLERVDSRSAEGGALTYVSHEDDHTRLPTLVAVHSTERAVGFTDTEYRAWLKVYADERRHLAAVAKACLDADIAERRQAVLEARGEMIRSLVVIAFRIAGVVMDEARQLAIIAEATRTVAKELPA